MENSETKKVLTAAYVPFKTFLSSLDHLKSHGVPNIIDRSVFPSASGATQSQLISALQFFELINDKGLPKESLFTLVDETDRRKENLKAILEKKYSNLFSADLTRVTPSQFESLFSAENYGVSGDTRKKAKSFFFFALNYVGVPHSKLLTQRTRSLRKKKSDGGGNAGQPPVNPDAGKMNTRTQDTEDAIEGKAIKTVELDDSKKTIWLGTDANFLEIRLGRDMDFVLALIKLFDAYERKRSFTLEVEKAEG